MKFKLRVITIAFLIGLLPGFSFADEAKTDTKPEQKTESKTQQKKSLNPWADCGIGAMIFDETVWAAATSNIIWDLGTTATTSNVSSQETCNSKKAQMAMYIGASYANLEEETVKGDGEHVHAMLNIMGCDAAVHSEIISNVRTEFRVKLQNSAYSDNSKQVKAQEYYKLVADNIDDHYAQRCQAI